MKTLGRTIAIAAVLTGCSSSTPGVTGDGGTDGGAGSGIQDACVYFPRDLAETTVGGPLEGPESTGMDVESSFRGCKWQKPGEKFRTITVTIEDRGTFDQAKLAEDCRTPSEPGVYYAAEGEGACHGVQANHNGYSTFIHGSRKVGILDFTSESTEARLKTLAAELRRRIPR